MTRLADSHVSSSRYQISSNANRGKHSYHTNNATEPSESPSLARNFRFVATATAYAGTALLILIFWNADRTRAQFPNTRQKQQDKAQVDQDWMQGYHQAYDHLHEVPEARRFIENNKTSLKSGDYEFLFKAITMCAQFRDPTSREECTKLAARAAMGKEGELTGYVTIVKEGELRLHRSIKPRDQHSDTSPGKDDPVETAARDESRD